MNNYIESHLDSLTSHLSRRLSYEDIVSSRLFPNGRDRSTVTDDVLSTRMSHPKRYRYYFQTGSES